MSCAEGFVALFLICVTHGLLIPTPAPTGCIKDGVHYNPGDIKTDPCHLCFCHDNGQISCGPVGDCFHVPCVDSVKVDYQCCPICPNGGNCRHEDGTIIKDGEQYHPDPYTTCECPDVGPRMPFMMPSCVRSTPPKTTVRQLVPTLPQLVPTIPH